MNYTETRNKGFPDFKAQNTLNGRKARRVMGRMTIAGR
jgi:hypothetical protein